MRNLIVNWAIDLILFAALWTIFNFNLEVIALVVLMIALAVYERKKPKSVDDMIAEKAEREILKLRKWSLKATKS